MTWFWNRITFWSSLHELVRIPESFLGSVFKLPVYRLRSEHISGSHEWVRIVVTRNPTQTYKNKYTLNTHTCTQTHTCIPTLIFIEIWTYIHMYIHTYTCIHIPIYIHAFIITPINIITHKHPYYNLTAGTVQTQHTYA